MVWVVAGYSAGYQSGEDGVLVHVVCESVNRILPVCPSSLIYLTD